MSRLFENKGNDHDGYYAVNGQQRGPVEQDDLAALAREGKLKPGDEVWNATRGSQWAKAVTVPGLFAVSDSTPPPVPSVTLQEIKNPHRMSLGTKKVVVAIAAVVGCVGLLCGFVLSAIQMKQGDKVKAIIATLASNDIRLITVATNDISDPVVVGPDAVASFVEALKTTQDDHPNHPAYEKTFQVEVTTKDDTRLQFEFHKMYGDNETIFITIVHRSGAWTGILGNQKSATMFEWMRRQHFL